MSSGFFFTPTYKKPHCVHTINILYCVYEIIKKSHGAVGKQQVPNLQIMTRWGVIIHQRYQKRGMTPVAEVQGIDDLFKLFGS